MFSLLRINLFNGLLIWHIATSSTVVQPTSMYGSSPGKPCKDTDWQCSVNSQCLDFNHVCDNIPDCPDASDEGPQLCDQSFAEPVPADTDTQTVTGQQTTHSPSPTQSHKPASTPPRALVTDTPFFKKEAVLKIANGPSPGEEGVPLNSIPEIVFLGWFQKGGSNSEGSAGLIVKEKPVEPSKQPVVGQKPATSALDALRELIRISRRGGSENRTTDNSRNTTTPLMLRHFPTTATPTRTSVALTTNGKSAIRNCILDDTHNDFCRRKYRGYFPFPTDCRKYLVCEWGYSHVCHCPNLTVWDTTLRTCIWEYQTEPCGTAMTTTTPTYTFTTSTSPRPKAQTMHPFFRALFSDTSDNFISGRVSPQVSRAGKQSSPRDPTIFLPPTRRSFFAEGPTVTNSPVNTNVVPSSRSVSSLSTARSPEVLGTTPGPTTVARHIPKIGVPMLSNFFDTGIIRSLFNNRNNERSSGS